MQVSAHQLHYREEFGGGNVCEKTGMPRSASVRYFCQLKGKLRDEYATPRRRVARMTEVRTCVYEIDVVIPGLCAHTAFKVGVVVIASKEFSPLLPSITAFLAPFHHPLLITRYLLSKHINPLPRADGGRASQRRR